MRLLRRDRRQCGDDACRHRLDEPRMIVEKTQFLDPRSVGPNLFSRALDVLKVLTATGVRGKGRGDKRQGTADAVFSHLLQSVRQERVPVSVSPIDGQMGTVGIEFRYEGSQEGPILRVDRARASQHFVMLGHLADALLRHRLAPEHILKERDHVLRFFRSTERNQKQTVVGRLHCSSRNSVPSRKGKPCRTRLRGAPAIPNAKRKRGNRVAALAGTSGQYRGAPCAVLMTPTGFEPVLQA